MALPSLEKIEQKAVTEYNKFLKRWIRGEADEFAPVYLFKRLTLDSGDVSGSIAAHERLVAKCKANRGWGYTLHREMKGTRNFGKNVVPTAIAIDTLDDLLRLAGKEEEFAATQRVVKRVREELPALEAWLTKRVKSLHKWAEPIDGLIAVTRFLLENPWPDVYARGLPIAVDTKFIDRHKAMLKEWLDLLPGIVLDPTEDDFFRRYGLTGSKTHWALRLLDPALGAELNVPFAELSLPLETLATLRPQDVTVLIVENRTSLFTLPPLPRTIAIDGNGNAVVLLARLPWIHTNRLVYWGDLDVEGLQILARLRNEAPRVESVMMDEPTLAAHSDFIGDGAGKPAEAPTNLTPTERAAFDFCAHDNRRLEQEKIAQAYLEERLREGLRCV